eukprot:TRINITY_DN4449_c0_g1_i2.p1 TRINITY_DN4449_c0_g1~~TRINITY_DN4449_c0_g1_i2.p1  ORF type:complete len:115 (+),score=22.37 TRINITY_DN4449_c0_g1_i2:33-377(+)
MLHTVQAQTYTTGHTRWNGVWSEPTNGDGLIVEGEVDNVRNHTVADNAGNHARYQVVVLHVTAARKRAFDAKGEIDTQLAQKETFKRTGYLPQYKHVEVHDPYNVPVNEGHFEL